MKEIISRYYKLVDEESFEEMFKLFSKDITYIRDNQEIKGMGNFKKFYLEERKLKGIHSIKEIYENKNKILTKGVYNGYYNNQPTTIHFTDKFQFNEEGKISKRITKFI